MVNIIDFGLQNKTAEEMVTTLVGGAWTAIFWFSVIFGVIKLIMQIFDYFQHVTSGDSFPHQLVNEKRDIYKYFIGILVFILFPTVVNGVVNALPDVVPWKKTVSAIVQTTSITNTDGSVKQNVNVKITN